MKVSITARSTISIGILGSADGAYLQRLLKAARAYAVPGVEVEASCVSFSDLAVGVRGDGESAAAWRDGSSSRPVPADFDAMLVRTMPMGSLEQVIFRMDALQVMQNRGVLVLNAPRVLETAIDKWLTLHRLSQAGVSVPATIVCQTRDAALEAFEQLGGDVVVKPIFGGEGRGMLRVADRDLAWRVFSTLEQTRSVLYVQQFLPHFGYDVRVLFLGEQHWAIRRSVSANGDGWRTNLSQGSLASAYELSELELKVARVAARAVMTGSGAIRRREAAQVELAQDDPVEPAVLGVDLLPCTDGSLRVLEVNAVPGWKGVEQVTGVDIAARIVQYVVEQVS